MKTITLLAGLALSLSLLAARSSAAEEAALRTVVYDIAGLGQAEHADMLGLPVMPFLDEDGEEEGGDGDLLEAFYLLLVDSLYADEFQYEGREIEMLNDRQLLVTAPSEVHGGVSALLNYLDAASSRRAVIRWDIYELYGIASSQERLAPATIDELVQRGEAVLVQSRTENVPVGRTVRRASERTHQLLSEWEREIATSALAQMPKLQNLIGGVTLLLRVEDVPGGQGQRLRMAQRIVGDPSLLRENADSVEVVVLENNTASLATQRSLEVFRASATTLAGSAVLFEGEALQASGWCGSLSGVSGTLTQLVLEHVDPAPAAVVVAGTEIRLLDLSAFYWSGLDAPRTQAWRMQGREGQQSTSSYRESADGTLTFPGEAEGWDGSVSPLTEPFEWEGGASWDDSNWLLLAGAATELAGLVDGLGARLAPTGAVKFEWGVVDGEGAPLAGGGLDLEQGADGLVLVGEALSYLHGRKVDVATNAMSSGAELAEAFDGLWLVAHVNGRGGVDIDLARNHLASLTEASLDQGREVSFQRAVFDSTDVRVRCAADGKRHELAELSPGPGNARFWVRATLR